MNKINTRDEQYNQTHLLIYNTFHALLQDNPFEKITVRQICTACDISIGSFYHHYKNKDEIIESGYSLFDEAIKEIVLNKKSYSNTEEKLLFLFELELDMIGQQGYASAGALFGNQLTYQNPYILDEERFFFYELVATAQKYIEEKNMQADPKKMIRRLLRVSRGSIYDWCLHKGDYPLVEETLPIIKTLLETY